MILFIFGAGASYDSDPLRSPNGGGREAGRPPLANQLFYVDNDFARAAVEQYPRVKPAVMKLRAEINRGVNVEAALQDLQKEAAYFPEASAQLMAVQCYLQQLLSSASYEWIRNCTGLTNYVSAMNQAARWAAKNGESVECVTFNYDTLLEEGIEAVNGQKYIDLGSYTNNIIPVYKPHGSVTWARRAHLPGNTQRWGDARGARRYACDHANAIKLSDDYAWRRLDQPLQDDGDTQIMWLPALAIPIEGKTEFVIPSDQLDSLTSSLGSVTMVIAIGWRGGERHFLSLLSQGLRSDRSDIPLVVVSESRESADVTLRNLREVLRFGRYLLLDGGFTQFAEFRDTQPISSRRPPTNLTDVLVGNIEWAG